MAVVNKTRNMLEGLVREGSFKWLMKQRSGLFDEEPHGEISELRELSSMANTVIRRCSKILVLSAEQLRENFISESSDPVKHQSNFARNFLEYCCFMALARAIQETGYLEDSKFRRLTFDMMIAWEYPDAACETPVDDHNTVGIEAFARMAPAIPLVSNVVISDKVFEVLAASTNNQLHYSVYDKYLVRLERSIQKWKSQSESSLLSSLRSNRVEKILEIDGTVTTQPVFEHVGKSAWPGRLVLTDHALYFEALKVVSYDKAKVYDLADELQQVVRPALSGPWGTRLFDRAVFYKSIQLSEPVIMGFPELKGHSRRDYWLAIIREVLNAHRFLHKFQISGPEHEEVLLRTVFGILRLQALRELIPAVPLPFDSLLMFNVCDQLPGGDLILEKLANMLTMRDLDQRNNAGKSCNGMGMYSVSASTLASNLGFISGPSSPRTNYDSGFVVGEIIVGEMTALEKAVKNARNSYESVMLAQATVDGVKVNGIDTKLAVMKELISPALQCWNFVVSLHNWEDPFKSLVFCVVFTYVIFRGWITYACATVFIFMALCMLLTRFYGRVHALKVHVPPPMNTMEQLLAVQNAISQAEELIQDGNIILLKCRALLLSIFPQATERFAVALLVLGLFLALVPLRYTVLLVFLETFTRCSPIRKTSTERCLRRWRDWWFSIPAAPVILEKASEEKKKK